MGCSASPSLTTVDMNFPAQNSHNDLRNWRLTKEPLRSPSDTVYVLSLGQDTEENKTKGFDYLLKAAEAGDRHSMILVARAFDTGLNLSPDRYYGCHVVNVGVIWTT